MAHQEIAPSQSKVWNGPGRPPRGAGDRAAASTRARPLGPTAARLIGRVREARARRRHLDGGCLGSDGRRRRYRRDAAQRRRRRVGGAPRGGAADGTDGGGGRKKRPRGLRRRGTADRSAARLYGAASVASGIRSAGHIARSSFGAHRSLPSLARTGDWPCSLTAAPSPFPS